MKENTIITNGKHTTSANTERAGTVAPSADKAAGNIAIDFHSAEFNQTDDLNDCCGNCRTFQSLDGVVTADMRHQRERMHERHAVDADEDKTASSKIIEWEKTKAATLDAFPPLTVISHGRTLIVDTDTDHAVGCGKLLSDQGLTCTLLVIKKETPDVSFSRQDDFAILTAGAASITGAFGAFSAQVTVREVQRNLSEWFHNEESIFDLILDLQSTPSYAGNLLPLGYFAPGADPAKFHEAMMELPGMRGRFTKPQFTSFLESRCTHDRSRKSNCRQCLTVCPYGAISSADRKISINHYLCQGCGGCALICPADAIRMVESYRENVFSDLRSKLKDTAACDAFAPTLAISDIDITDGYSLPCIDHIHQDGGIHFTIDEIGYVGLEMLLTALVCGAGRVIVACGPQNTPALIEAVKRQVLMGQAILKGLNLPEDRINFTLIPHESDQPAKDAFLKIWKTQPDTPVLPPVDYLPVNDKRTMIRLAVQYLYDHSGAQQSSFALPAGSAFGTVEIDSAACTLCTACASACPSGALIACGTSPKLEFIESRCHQCHLCEDACPEGAMHLLPRMLCDLNAVNNSIVIHEAQPVRCIECGVPFASQAMIRRIQGKLTGHWMYANDRQLRRLQMCSLCRTRDAFMSNDVKSWSQQ